MVGSAGATLIYDAENRLQSVTSGGETVTFTYDGDGRRVLRDTVTETVAYVGPHYEARFTKTNKPEDLDDDCLVTVIDIMRVAAQWGAAGGPEDLDDSGTVDAGDIQRVAGQWRETCHVLAGTTKYYALGGRRIAMRKAGTLYYLFTDRLNSTSVTYNTANGQTQTLRYYPWGSVRSGDVPTDRRFTGQRWDATIGLYDYNARWYEPALGRFVQPDTIVPEPGDPQSLNRYSYVLNNPLRHTDPSGHAECVDADCNWVVHPVSGNLIRRGHPSPSPAQPTGSWQQFLLDAFTFNIFDVGMVGESRPTVQMQGQAEAAYWEVVTFTRAHTPRPILAVTDAMGRFLDEHPEVMMGIQAAMMTAGAPPKPWGSNRYYYRYISSAEREGIQESIAASGGRTAIVESRSGQTYLSPTRYESARQAQDFLGMPNTPAYRVRVPAAYVDEARAIHTGIVDPVEMGLGGGWELLIEGGIEVPVDALIMEPLKP